MKCQRCHKPATLHITEVLPEERFEELHFCDECGKKYLANASKPVPVLPAPAELVSVPEPGEGQCEICGMKYVEFRNSGRLGCPHDYEAFREELLPLLESIHGDTKHQGKRPRRRPEGANNPRELASLRKKLQKAVEEEAYETAAQLRDRIRELEES